MTKLIKKKKDFLINITISSVDRLIIAYSCFGKFSKFYRLNKGNVIDYNLKYFYCGEFVYITYFKDS